MGREVKTPSQEIGLLQQGRAARKESIKKTTRITKASKKRGGEIYWSPTY